MAKFRVETSSPEFYKGVTGTVYTVHDEVGRVRGMHYDDEQTANDVCNALNNGDQLSANLRYKHNQTEKSAVIPTTYSSAEDILYYHVQNDLPGTTSMSLDQSVHKALALSEAGYSEPSVTWLPIGV